VVESILEMKKIIIKTTSIPFDKISISTPILLLLKKIIKQNKNTHPSPFNKPQFILTIIFCLGKRNRKVFFSLSLPDNEINT